MSNQITLLLSDITMSAIQAEATRAYLRHGTNLMLYGTDERKLAILAEEFGEIARELNELALGNIDSDTYRERTERELIQVAAMAATWIEAINGKGREVNDNPPLAPGRIGQCGACVRSGVGVCDDYPNCPAGIQTTREANAS